MRTGENIFILLLIVQGVLLIQGQPLNEYAEEPSNLELNYDNDDAAYKILVRGQTLELQCNTSITNATLSWSYPRNFNPQGRMTQFVAPGRSIFLIKNAGDKDVGNYTCHLNEGSPEYESRDIRVIVAPMLKINQEMKDGNLVLKCLVHAFPTPYVHWKIDFDEKPADLDVPEFNPDGGYKVDEDTELVVDNSIGRYVLSDFEQVSNAMLMVTNASSSDYGRYRCVAKNEAGQAIATATYGPDLTIIYIVVPIIAIMIIIAVVVALLLRAVSKRMELMYLVV